MAVKQSLDGLNRGPWQPQEDELLKKYVEANGVGSWSTLPQKAGLMRCGKSCRLRWMNYLRPNLKRGRISPDEEDLIIRLHKLLGNRWSLIAARVPGRTDNDVKNYWNIHLSKKVAGRGVEVKFPHSENKEAFDYKVQALDAQYKKAEGDSNEGKLASNSYTQKSSEPQILNCEGDSIAGPAKFIRLEQPCNPSSSSKRPALVLENDTPTTNSNLNGTGKNRAEKEEIRVAEYKSNMTETGQGATVCGYNECDIEQQCPRPQSKSSYWLDSVPWQLDSYQWQWDNLDMTMGTSSTREFQRMDTW